MKEIKKETWKEAVKSFNKAIYRITDKKYENTVKRQRGFKYQLRTVFCDGTYDDGYSKWASYCNLHPCSGKFLDELNYKLLIFLRHLFMDIKRFNRL